MSEIPGTESVSLSLNIPKVNLDFHPSPECDGEVDAIERFRLFSSIILEFWDLDLKLATL